MNPHQLELGCDLLTEEDSDRTALRSRIDLAVARLVARADTEAWQVRADHCFLRIAYDNAVGARWDAVYPRPAWRTLPIDRLAAALEVLDRIDARGQVALDAPNAASLAFRRASR